MEPHCLLRIFFSLNLILITVHAALPTELYWNMMFPSSPVPKAIIDLLRGDMNTGKSVDTEIQSTNGFPNSHFGAKDIPPQENFFSYGAKKTQSRDGILISELGAKDIPPQENFFHYISKKPQSRDGLLISDLGANDIPPQENFFLYGAKKTQSRDGILISELGAKDIPPQENFFHYISKKPQSRDGLLISDLGANDIPPQENFFLYGAKKTQSRDGLLISDLGAKDIPPQENFFHYISKKTQSRNGLLISDLGAKDIPPQENFFLYGAKKTQSRDGLLISDLGAKDIPPQEKNFHYISKKTQLANDLNVRVNPGAYFFQEDQLHPGNKFYVQLDRIKSAVPLLPRQISEQIPFSLDKVKETMEILSVKLNSKNAEIIEETIGDCEAPPVDGEAKYCATSLESMMDFIASKLGKNVRAMSTEVGKETKPQNLVVKDGVKRLESDHIISCHPMTYPYVVFMCHESKNTTAYFAPLEGDDGVRVKSVAVCHKDTSKWNPDHLAFQALKVQPGTVPVCHFFPEGHLLWLSK